MLRRPPPIMLKRLLHWLIELRKTSGIRPLWALGYASGVVLVVVTVLRYYAPDLGYTSLIVFGEKALENYDWTADRDVQVYLHPQSWGYDGQYYAQLALDPWLQDPLLNKTVDNLPYRARRILLSWTAHLLGLGRPQWVLNVFALQNLVCWVGLGVLLLRWFPPTDFDRAFRWFGVMFATGVCLSVTFSLADGPSLLLLALALRWWEQGYRWRSTAVLAMGGLLKETNILAGAVSAPADWRSPRGWALGVGRGLLIAAPIGLWLVVLYHHLTYAASSDLAGEGNFSAPLVAVGQRVAELFDESRAGGMAWRALAGSWAALISLMTQSVYLLIAWRWKEPAWRLTVPFAALALVIGSANWDGHPGAVTRSLLPMLLGFNLLLPSGRRWWPWLILGNLTMWFAPLHFVRPVGPGYVAVIEQVEAGEDASPLDMTKGLRLEFPGPWYMLESDRESAWRWAADDADIVLINPFAQTLELEIAGSWAARSERNMSIRQGDTVLWQERLGPRPSSWRLTGIILPPGESRLRIFSDEAATPADGRDQRPLAFRLIRLELRARPVKSLPPDEPSGTGAF